ncbi:PorV/PorQ family protein [Algoriphagus kandeliae]|uniref:PorV/PorQ family protein n=1 Tax=Algoriphagus kandeliae TaxID=2562278 RepID=A0A4Y9QSC7_9BACT|nr:PorV/PorQ family protein [Algoriphagus kandeliae]
MKNLGSFLRLFGCILFLFCHLSEAAGQDLTPKYSNEFLNIGVGARALGMGGAQVSAVRDVTASFWNPAGLFGTNHKYEATLMHAEYFAGIAQFDYLAFTTPLKDQSQIAVSLIRFGVDDIPDTRFLYDANGALNYNNIQFFNAADYALLLTYARAISDKIKVGANAKVIHRNVGKFASAWGFGLDVGGMYVHKKLTVGLMLRDITTTFNAWAHNAELVRDIYSSTNNEIPLNSVELTLPRAISSVSYIWSFGEKFALTSALDLEMTFDGNRNTVISTSLLSIDPRLGLELGFKKSVFIRAGISNLQYIKNFQGERNLNFLPSTGLGFIINERFQIDYALSDIGNVSDTPYSHIFSVKVSLEKLKEEDRKFKGWEY